MTPLTLATKLLSTEGAEVVAKITGSSVDDELAVRRRRSGVA